MRQFILILATTIFIHFSPSTMLSADAAEGKPPSNSGAKKPATKKPTTPRAAPAKKAPTPNEADAPDRTHRDTHPRRRNGIRLQDNAAFKPDPEFGVMAVVPHKPRQAVRRGNTHTVTFVKAAQPAKPSPKKPHIQKKKQ